MIRVQSIHNPDKERFPDFDDTGYTNELSQCCIGQCGLALDLVSSMN